MLVRFYGRGVDGKAVAYVRKDFQNQSHVWDAPATEQDKKDHRAEFARYEAAKANPRTVDAKLTPEEWERLQEYRAHRAAKAEAEAKAAEEAAAAEGAAAAALLKPPAGSQLAADHDPHHEHDVHRAEGEGMPPKPAA